MHQPDDTSPRVLFVESVHEVLDERLTAAGFACEHRHTDPAERLREDLHLYTGLVIRSRIRLDEAFLSAGTRLKFIARSGSGLENIDLGYAAARGIQVFSSPEGNRVAVGEHAMGMLLCLLNRIHLAHAEVRSGLWKREANRGFELAGKCVGIIGYGHMGSAFAQRLRGFGCEVIALDKYLRKLPDDNARLVEPAEFHSRAEVVSLHLPLTGETHHYADAAFFSRFAQPIWFLNTARGSHTDSLALADALDSGKVLGAALDVLEFEKSSLEGLKDVQDPALRRLISHPGVLLTPHVAGWTFESYVKLSSVLADKILAWWAEGKQPARRG